MEGYTEMLQRLIPELLNIFQGSINSIILYGSVARGTQTAEPDVDIAVIVKDYTKDMHETMTDFITI